jgi:methyltransferase, FkbM family
VHLNQCAVGDNVVDVPFTVPADLRIAATSSINGEFTRNLHAIDYKTITVKQQTLDQVLSYVQFTSDDVIKIDVEYYEMNVLCGASKIIEQHKPIILIEILQYDALVNQFDAMRDKINPQHIHFIIFNSIQ